MAYNLIDYFNRRLAVIEKEKTKKEPGPFVTISRETGCGGNEIAELLIRQLNSDKTHWSLVNKEIISQAARNLKVDIKRVAEVIDSKERTTMNEIVDALSYRYYKNDRIVRKKVAEILRFDAQKGYVVIVGRGGVSVTRDIEKGLHIKLEAPVSWRVKSIMERKMMTLSEAEKFVEETDQKRIHLLEQLSNKKNEEIYFDLHLNCMTFSKDEIVKMIINAMKIKRLI
jgi:cytidylate kinase